MLQHVTLEVRPDQVRDCVAFWELLGFTELEPPPILRDRFTCQYCGDDEDLTFDHLVPRSRGGLTRWENVVTACAPCNLMKGGKLPAEARMHPAQKPYRPTVFELHRNGRLFPPNYLHESWLDYLYWDTELEP